MKHAKERGWWGMALVLAGSIGLSGCMGAPETRFLSCIPRPPGVEARSYDLHDPFPDESAGPETFTRPRAFQEPRSDTRKTNDLRFLQATQGLTPSTQAYWDPRGPNATAHAPIQPIWRTPASTAPIAVVPRMWDGGSQYNVVAH
jgi:hypothetical protein